MEHLFHITAWPYTAAALRPPSLDSEGFVHLSSAQQLLRTAQRWYGSASEIAVLVLSQSRLGEVVWEDLYERGEAFPHLYGPLPDEAVCAVLRLSRDESGQFAWPAGFEPAPLLEGPDQGEALIEPSRRFSRPILPEVGVLCFFPGVAQALGSGVVRHPRPGSALGVSEVVVVEVRGQSVAVGFPGFGSPLAAVALEEMIAQGCRRLVCCGGAGSLLPEQLLGQVVLVSEALRDEGVSYHYRAPGRTVSTASLALQAAADRLDGMGISYLCGATWTTDALYRETPSRLARRRDEGCLTVEMEAAALLAVASFRGVPLVPLLSVGDDLSGPEWDFRDWTSDASGQEKLFWLAVELALALPEDS